MGYMLRRVILEHCWPSQLKELLELCPRAGIEEVLLMEQSHQVLMVPFPLAKHQRMADIYCRMADELRKAGIRFSINLATLVGHADADVPDTLVLPYQKWVGEDLIPAKANYCILDPAWQDYAARVCALYAAAKPDKMYIDDDFRSMNHTRLVGCFCPIHVEKTGDFLGIRLTVQELLTHVCGGTEEDLRIRRAWMAINFEGQKQAARTMRLATEKICPRTRLGLMNSGEPHHSIQGRDMDQLLREFSGPSRQPLSRPAGGGYNDFIHGEVFVVHQTMALSMAQVGGDVQVTSEVENWPHSRFLKSIRSTEFQLKLHALAGADDFTLNLYDYLATPFAQESDYEKMLISLKQPLSVIQNARKNKRARGFGLPWRNNYAEFRTSVNNRIQDLVPDRILDSLLPQFGIPTQFTPAVGNAILGDDVQGYNDDEIREFLTGGLLLDGRAAGHLIRRGFGNHLGCTSIEILHRAATERLGEHEFCGPFAGNILPTNWFRLEPDGKYAYRLKLNAKAVFVSMLTDLEMAPMAPGTVLFENSLGGRVALLAAPIDSWSWLHRGRSYLMGKIIQWLMKGTLPLWIEDAPGVGPFYYEHPETREGLLGIVSGNLDVMPLTIHSTLKFHNLLNPSQGMAREIEGLTIHFYQTS